MSKTFSAAAIAMAHHGRFAGPAQPGTINEISASGATPLPSVQAAEVRGFASVAGSLRWVKATENFFQNFASIGIGDYVQVAEDDAKRLIASGRAAAATDDEVAAASKSKSSK